MTNKELLLKVKEELNGYRIGLHHASFHKYLDGVYDGINGVVTDESIAENIIKKGIIVRDHGIGLSSTIHFLSSNLNERDFNYVYFPADNDEVYDVIVAIPYNIMYQGEKYFIGGDGDANIANNLLFNYCLYSPFVYGYYKKEVLECSDHCEYSNELSLALNPNFWSQNKQSINEKIMSAIINNRKNTLSAIKLANSNIPAPLIVHPDRFFIQETQQQLKMMKH